MKILFISRAYPPVWGGIEMQNFGIANALTKIADTKIIANTGGKKRLPLFLPWVFLKGFFLVPAYDAVLFGDGVLSPIGAFWKIFYKRTKFFSIIHGLDITFAQKKSILGKIYRHVNIPSHKRMDRLIMVGNETISQAVAIGIAREKCVFIPNGLELDEICANYSRKDLGKIAGLDLGGKKVIFRGGRFTKHKGVEWFIRNVMPELPENYVLLAAGGAIASKTAGDENNYPNCEKAVVELGLTNRVKLLVNLPREEIKILFNACDLYISPNIKVAGSMEGFGITAIEGGACGRMVLASNLEGLKDAIQEGQNGFLVEPENADAWIKKISELLENDSFREEFGQKARQFVMDNYSWEKISQRYLEEIQKTINA
jgi:phosphatidylinositol alpha-1,6-mannosyltransferase